MKSQRTQIIKRWLPYVVACFLPIWTSCQTSHPLVLQRVGPRPTATSADRLNLVGAGYLQVYSGTELKHVGRPKYYPHSDYTIYSSEGKVVQQVENATGPTDETPALVSLPAGFYRIEAQDDDYGRVIVPVVIEGSQTTTVHLNMDDNPANQQQQASAAVRLPDNRWVGWRAPEPLEEKTGH